MNRKQLLLIATTALTAAASSAQSALLTYDFTVNATSGALAGESSTGFFSFDDTIIPSVIPAGGVAVSEVGLLTDLQFVWDGIAYDETMANTGYFIFRPGGVFDACFGTNASAGGCGVGVLGDWYVALYSIGSGAFAYSAELGSVGEGTVTYAAAAPVPEPSIFALAGVAIASLFLSRRWKRVSQTC